MQCLALDIGYTQIIILFPTVAARVDVIHDWGDGTPGRGLSQFDQLFLLVWMGSGPFGCRSPLALFN